MNINDLVSKSLNKAASYFSDGDYPNAEELYRQILRVDKNNREATLMGSLCIARNGNPSEAVSWLENWKDKDHYFYNNLGLIYGSWGSNNKEKAIHYFREALKVKDEYFLRTNLALELKRNGEVAEAIEIFENMKDCRSEHVYFNYGTIVYDLGDYEKARFLYEKALKINNDYPACHYNLSACCFLLGDYKKGWEEYEWRWKQFPKFSAIRDCYDKPYWRGEKGRVLLYSEQGVGDTIQFYRFVKEVKDSVFLCHDCLKPLLFGEEGDFDYHCSIMSLPGILGVDEPVACGRYLKSSFGLSEAWQKYKLKVGICWAGNPMHPNDKNRSCYLRNFRNISSLATIFSLQKDTRKRIHDNIVVDYLEDGEFPIIDLKEHMQDFNCTAALIEAMDLVITVDTAIAHLAGALGKSCWLLLPFNCDWRWQISKEKLWYESVRIFRQRKMGDWDGLFEEVNKAFSVYSDNFR